jgi:hypothetical protein
MAFFSRHRETTPSSHGKGFRRFLTFSRSHGFGTPPPIDIGIKKMKADSLYKYLYLGKKCENVRSLALEGFSSHTKREKA